MGRTRVVNIRKETCNVYIGRAGYGKDGYFGNPFRLEATMAKGSTLGRYRKYFYHRLSTDKEFRKRIGNLQGKTLGWILVMGTSLKNTWTGWLKMRMKQSSSGKSIGKDVSIPSGK